MACRDADIIQQWLGEADITGLAAREEKAQRRTVDVAEHMNFGSQITTAAA